MVAARSPHAAALAELISRRLLESKASLAAEFSSPHRIRTCFLDALLPEDLPLKAFAGIPPTGRMVRREGSRERKYVSSNLGTFSPELAALVLAFNDPRVVAAISEITGIRCLESDAELYNGGITTMKPTDFMCPHLDNSHDYGRIRKRRVVALYYLTPEWQRGFGGHLELWDELRRRQPREVEYCFNRLVLMETSERSWHSVSTIVGEADRTNITCYYYLQRSATIDPVRLTRFRARPGSPVRNFLCQLDCTTRSLASRLVRRRLVRNRHLYDDKR
jgi:hypothetical protein